MELQGRRAGHLEVRHPVPCLRCPGEASDQLAVAPGRSGIALVGRVLRFVLMTNGCAMLRYQLFPRSVGLNPELHGVIACFEAVYDAIRSPENTLNSDGVLQRLKPHLEAIGFKIEAGKAK